MSNIERLLGRLEQFMDHSEFRFEKNDADHAEIKAAIDELKGWRMRVIGGAGALGALVGLLARFI